MSLLTTAIENGIIDLPSIQQQVEQMNREKLLANHPYDIWFGARDYWYTYLPSKEGRVQKKRKTKEQLENLIVEYWSQRESTVEVIFNEWNKRRVDLNKISKATYDRNIQIFNRHFSTLREVAITSLDEDDISDFLEEELAEKHLTAKAFSNLKGVTRGIFKRAKKLHLITFSIDNVINDLDVSDKEFKRLKKTPEQEVFNNGEIDAINRLFEANFDLESQGVMLMFATGMRVGELVCLQPNDISNHTISITKTETRHSMNNHYIYEIKDSPKTDAGERTIVLPSAYYWLEEMLVKESAGRDYIFVNAKGQRLTTNSFRRKMERICKKAGIVQKSPHKIRKTYGSILLDNHCDLQFVKDQMGHSSISVTENYYHKDRKDLSEKTAILDGIEEFADISDAIMKGRFGIGKCGEELPANGLA